MMNCESASDSPREDPTTYKFGVKIRLEVDDAQLNLLQARCNLAKAQRDFRVAQVTYLWAMGVAGE